MLRVVFMGTPEFAVPALESLNRATEIVGVYTQPDRPVGRGLELRYSAVKVRARELGLTVHQPERLSLPGEFERLQALKPDAIVVVAYGQILRRNVLELPPLGCINIHSSLLPRWRGAAPIQWSILAGDPVTGVTTMHLVEKLDAGDILMQEPTPISADDTAKTVHDRLAQIGARLIVPTLEGLTTGALKGIHQDESQVTYASKLTKEMEWLDPSESAAALDRRVRALSPWPGTSLLVRLGEGRNERLKVKQARPDSEHSGAGGELFEKQGRLFLGTSEGALEFIRVQWEGKKEVDAAGFLNGLKGRGLSLPLPVERP